MGPSFSIDQSLALADFTRMTALASALRAGLQETWPHLGKHWTSWAALAEQTGRDPHLVRLECLALKHFGWVDTRPTGARKRARAPRDGVARDPLTWLEILDYYAGFAGRRMPQRLGERRAGDYYGMLERVAAPTSRVLIRGLGKRRGPRILDFGCGLAPHSRALLRARPDAELTLLDQPSVLKAVRKRLRGETDLDVGRVRFASSLEALSGESYDRVWLLNVLHELTEGEQVEMVGQLSKLVANGGQLVVQAFCRDRGPEWHADALEVATAIRTRGRSDVLSVATYVRMLAQVGLTVREVEGLDTPAGPANVMLIGSRRGGRGR